MTRPWVPLQSSTIANAKWIRSSIEERGAWATAILVALHGDPEGTVVHDTLVAHLEAGRASDPEALIARLVKLRLLDVLDENRYLVHDRETHWPLYRGPSDLPDAARERKRRSRHVTRCHDMSRDVTPSHAGHDRGEEKREEEIYQEVRERPVVARADKKHGLSKIGAAP